MATAHFHQSFDLIIKIAKLTHSYGIQSRRLEWFLSDVVETLGFDGEFSVLPNQLSITLVDNKNLYQETGTFKTNDIGFDVGKIEAIYKLVNKIKSGNQDIDQINKELDNINNEHCYKVPAISLGYMMASAGFAAFLQCDYISILISAIFGVLVYFILGRISKYNLGYVAPFAVTFFIGLISGVFAILHPDINPYIVALSGVIYLIPGFTISTGIIEISYKYTLSGLINLVNGMVSLILLFSSVYLSIFFLQKIIWFDFVFNLSIEPATHLQWLGAIIMSTGFSIIFQVPKNALLWSALATVVICVFLILSQLLFGSMDIGILCSTFSCTIMAFSWAKYYLRPESIILLPSTIFLVSGSIGFRGLISLTQDNYSYAAQQTGQMFITAICIAVGLILGATFFHNKNRTL
jgi:uncharacterized membrane protein YjjP (DUF1212 family)